jgi:hypothetical protein
MNTRILRSTSARRAMALVAGIGLACGATVGQAGAAQAPEHVRPNYQPCNASTSGSFYFTPGDGLPNGKAYCAGNWEFVNQTDGNLVIYYSTGQAVWASNTNVGFNLYDTIQTDGNFVIYNGSAALWSTGTYGFAGAYLCFQNDGNMVIYAPSGGFTCSGRALWASGT